MALVENPDDENNRPINQLRDESKEFLGIIYGIGMNVNSMVGVGIFTTPGIVWKKVKKPYVVILLWLFGGIVNLFGSLIYTEYGALHRDNGGEKVYLDKAYPSPPFPPFLASYLFSFMFIFVIRPVMICAVLQSAAQYAWYTCVGESPSLDVKQTKQTGWQDDFKPYWALKLIAILILLLITGYHLLNRKLANKINHTLAIIKMITVLIIAFGGILKSQKTEGWNNPSSDDDPININSYSVAITQIFFSYYGWNTLNYSLDEFRNPRAKLKISNISSIVIVTILYVLVNVAFITVIPFKNINSKVNNETLVTDFFSIFDNDDKHDVLVRVLSFFVVLSGIGTAATNVWSGSRVIVSAAESNFFPIFSSQLKKWREREINQRGQEGNNERSIEYTPVNALLAQLGWCIFIILIVGGSIPVDNFELFSSISTFSPWIFFIVTSWGLVKTRKRSTVVSPFKVRRTIIYLFIISGLIFIASSFVPDGGDRAYIIQKSFILFPFIFLLIGFICWFTLYRKQTIQTTTAAIDAIDAIETIDVIDAIETIHAIDAKGTDTVIDK